jgi:hypothetical protein
MFSENAKCAGYLPKISPVQKHGIGTGTGTVVLRSFSTGSIKAKIER